MGLMRYMKMLMHKRQTMMMGEDRGHDDEEERNRDDEEEINEDDAEDSEDGDYLPSDEEEDSVHDIHFTDSEDELDLDDNGFDVESEDEEGLHPVGGYDRDDDDEGELEDVTMYAVHKLVDDMANYPWRVGTVYANRDEFKKTVSSFAVHTARGIKSDKYDRMRVIAVCQASCPFRLYCVKMNEEDSWQL
ncbi:hypothetical protein PIB30_038865 [Stylosanthes scabra]|uniref:Transposase MuDR plant domain-containing protein n=1 Tax=Stylosanthes scabra TaxID=79078 RepID=A0ABU6WEA2_9FABA|nr:hypothetical protein [Stylosanthes scabra]